MIPIHRSRTTHGPATPIKFKKVEVRRQYYSFVNSQDDGHLCTMDLLSPILGDNSDETEENTTGFGNNVEKACQNESCEVSERSKQ